MTSHEGITTPSETPKESRSTKRPLATSRLPLVKAAALGRSHQFEHLRPLIVGKFKFYLIVPDYRHQVVDINIFLVQALGRMR